MHLLLSRVSQISEEQVTPFLINTSPNGNPGRLWKARGCRECSDYGHKGRIAVFELTRVNQSLGQDIAAGLGTKELSSRFETMRHSTMIQDLLHKVS